MKTIGACNIV